MFVPIDPAMTSGAIRIPPQQMRAIAGDAQRRSKLIAVVAGVSTVIYAGVSLFFGVFVNRVAVRDAQGRIIGTVEEPNGALLWTVILGAVLAALGLYYARNAIRAKRCVALADETSEWRLAGYGIFGLDRDEYPPPHLSFSISRWERARLLRVPTARLKR